MILKACIGVHHHTLCITTMLNLQLSIISVPKFQLLPVPTLLSKQLTVSLPCLSYFPFLSLANTADTFTTLSQLFPLPTPCPYSWHFHYLISTAEPFTTLSQLFPLPTPCPYSCHYLVLVFSVSVYKVGQQADDVFLQTKGWMMNIHLLCLPGLLHTAEYVVSTLSQSVDAVE